MKTRMQVAVFVIALGVLISGGLFTAHAQLIGQMDVDIPFSFYVQQTKLPAGAYVLKMLGDSDLQVLEISSADNKVSVLAEVEDSHTDKDPDTSYLIFNRYGKNEYLSKIFYVGTQEGNKIIMTRSELKLQKSGMKAKQHSVATRKQTQ